MRLCDARAMTVSPSLMRRGARCFVVVQGLLWLAGAAALGWRAGNAPWPQTLIWSAVLLVALWALVAVVRGRLSVWEALMVQAGALASATSALGLFGWHRAAKPAAMVFAIAAIAGGAWYKGIEATLSLKKPAVLLMLALAFALGGDVFLMLPDLFIPGLVSFLLCHLLYLRLFRQGDARWFALRPALWAALALGLGMYAFLWSGGLPVELRVPVAVYVLAIALMAAQAWARWHALRDAPALAVALGATCFMLSDSLLATNRFVQPLPWASLWVLATYYAAQALIVIGMRRWLRSSSV